MQANPCAGSYNQGYCQSGGENVLHADRGRGRHSAGLRVAAGSGGYLMQRRLKLQKKLNCNDRLSYNQQNNKMLI